MNTPRQSRATPGAGLLHPVAIGAIAVLLLNDHVWKHSHPGFLTGKISDVAGMIFFPLFLQALVECAQSAARIEWRPSRPILLGAAIATGLTLVLIKTIPAAGDAYRIGWGVFRWPLSIAEAIGHARAIPLPHKVSLTPDVTDVWAAPFVLIAIASGWRRTDGSIETAAERKSYAEA